MVTPGKIYHFPPHLSLPGKRLQLSCMISLVFPSSSRTEVPFRSFCSFEKVSVQSGESKVPRASDHSLDESSSVSITGNPQWHRLVPHCYFCNLGHLQIFSSVWSGVENCLTIPCFSFQTHNVSSLTSQSSELIIPQRDKNRVPSTNA